MIMNMKKYLVKVFSMTLLISAGIWFVSCQADDEKKVRVHIIGDSTMADYVENTTRTRGWGEVLQEFFTGNVEICNYARGGHSSHSFCKEGRWQIVLDSLQAGDYVFIQFAHNDETEGGKDGADGRGTAPWTTYKKYIEKYVDETRQKGATPILITPIIRRYFTSDGTISPKGCHDLSKAPDDSTLNYVRVMKHVARNKQVQLVDMTAMTKEFSETLGEEQTRKCIYVPTDGTHTQATGAACYARLAVEGLQSAGILADHIRKDIPLVLNPTSLDFKTLFVGEEAVACFDLVGLNLQPASGRLVVEAPEGMTVADSPEGEPQSVLEYDYTDGKLWNKCFYLHFTPSASGVTEKTVRIKHGDNERLLPVKALVKDIAKRSDITVTPSGMSFKGLEDNDGNITIEGGKWSAEIDEAQKRYAEVVVAPAEKTMLLRNLSFTLDGEIAYRVACAYGKDFYPRTDLGEAQKPVKGSQQLSFPMNVLLNPGQQLHVRIYPWSTTETDKLSFSVTDWSLDAVTLE